jgi:hypothetical protein
VRYPIKLSDDYSCQGTDADGRYIVFSDMLMEGDRVGPSVMVDDEPGEALYVDAVVERRSDGLYVVPLEKTQPSEEA